MNIEKVIEEYRNGDESKRLSLFLAYRDLREIFISIEDNSGHDDFTIIQFPWSRKHRLPQAA